VHTTVSLQDIAATVLAMANVVPGRAIPGRSLARGWSERGVAARPAISEVTITPDQAAMIPVTVGPMRSVVAGNFHYIRRGDGVEQLYDLSRDRAERRNVTAEAPAVTEQLRKAVSPERPTRVARRADK
jgi:arylsulfatase A-like enzyme